jgi:hypothetical protein
MKLIRSVQLFCFVVYALILHLPAVADQSSNTLAESDRKAISKIIDDYFGAWEPQRISAKELIAMSERIFETGPTFSMVVDAVY